MSKYESLVEPEELLDINKSPDYVWSGKDVVIGISKGISSVGIVMMNADTTEKQLVQSWMLHPRAKLLESTLESDRYNYLHCEMRGEILTTQEAWVTDEFVAEVIKAIASSYNVNLQAVGYDSWYCGHIAEILSEFPFNVQTVRISQRSNEIFNEAMLLRKKIKHNNIEFRKINHLLSHALMDTKIDIENKSVKSSNALNSVLAHALINASALTERMQDRFDFDDEYLKDVLMKLR